MPKTINGFANEILLSHTQDEYGYAKDGYDYGTKEEYNRWNERHVQN
tara:strand:+ start:253 stop:393 length:141 start_codon:yes stop_codon:yes gene_type:complete